MHSSSLVKHPFSEDDELFSSKFKQPEPPLVHAEFTCNWKQHAWSADFSQIASGFLYHSHSQGKVRADATYDSTIISSLFDYNDLNEDHEVKNRLYTIEPSVAAPPKIWTGFVKPAWPLFADDILVKSNAVFGGVVDERWAGRVAVWKIVYHDSAPVTVYLDSTNTVVGYDFYDTTTRTGIATRFSNVELGLVDGRVFDFPKETNAT